MIVTLFGLELAAHAVGPRFLAASSWVEVNLARINSAGKGVIGMKILGAGSLTNKIDECLQFALAQDCVDCFTIGSESRAQMEDLTKRIPAASVRG